MPNGSLEGWLHQSEDEQDHQRSLSLTQRLRTAMEVASALQHLHHHCQAALIHGDLMPSNILMDHDMTAHMGDFGVAHLLSDHSLPTSSQNKISSIGIKGNVGNVAPEYSMGSPYIYRKETY
ncbi:hypothetical protein CsSME_00043073 [Camellia sinensis var. sinensis]